MSRTTPLGVTTTVAVDAANRVSQVTEPVDATRSIVTAAGYDVAGNMTRVTNGNDQSTFQARPSDERVRSRRRHADGDAHLRLGPRQPADQCQPPTAAMTGNGSATFGYDQAGRLTSWVRPNGSTVTYGWDDAGNRTSAGRRRSPSTSAIV